MKVQISTLAWGEAEPFEASYQPADLGLDTQDLEFIESIVLKGTLLKEEGVLLVKAEASSRWRERCGRCLAATEKVVRVPIDLALHIRADMGHIDFTPELREEILLSYPEKFLCREDCKGLCSHCGTNLNVGECECSRREATDSPFQILKKLKKEEKS